MRYFRYFLSTILIIIASLVIYPKLKNSYYEIPQLFKEANKILLLLLVIFQIVSYFGDGWLSRIILKIAGFDVKLGDTIRIAILGVLGGQVAPIVGGTVLTYLFYKKLKIPSATILFLVVNWTIFIFFSHFLFFILSLLFLPKSFFLLIPHKAILIILIASLFLLLAIYFLLKNQARNLISLLNSLSKLVNRIFNIFKIKKAINFERLRLLIYDFNKNFTFLSNSRNSIPRALLASLIFYLGNIFTLYFSFLVFRFRPNLAILVFGYTISLILTIFTLMPETPGVMEASLVMVFVGVGFPSHIALFSTLLFWLFSFWLPLPLGILSFVTMNNKANNKT